MTNSQARNDFIIAPSILSADFARLGEEVNSVLDAGAGFIHFDVMDNHFVPNLSFGPMICEALRNHGVTAPIDVHLMVEPVDNMVDSFAKAGASYISFHPEATRHPDRTLQLIKSHGCKAGVVLNPATPIESIKHLIPQIDMLLLMSVNPGFGGQQFIPYTIDKLKEARAYLDTIGSHARLEVDGGVKTSNIAEVAKAGADTFVAGSAIFGADNYKDVINQMNTALAEI